MNNTLKLKTRLSALGFLEFAVWGAYLSAESAWQKK